MSEDDYYGTLQVGRYSTIPKVRYLGLNMLKSFVSLRVVFLFFCRTVIYVICKVILFIVLYCIIFYCTE